MFQFLSGSIKRRVKFYEFYRFIYSFNSFPVRLKAIIKPAFSLPISCFNSFPVRLKVGNRNGANVKVLTVFQFLSGSIKSVGIEGVRLPRAVFQFLSGSIKRQDLFFISKVMACFNSFPVRLKV